jgi:hypothetical protein
MKQRKGLESDRNHMSIVRTPEIRQVDQMKTLLRSLDFRGNTWKVLILEAEHSRIKAFPKSQTFLSLQLESCIAELRGGWSSWCPNLRVIRISKSIFFANIALDVCRRS